MTAFKLITILFLTVLIFSCKEKTPNKTNSNYYEKDFYKNGKLRYEGQYINGKQNGIWKWYWENGKIKDLAEFKEGKYVNYRFHFFENGKLNHIEYISQSEYLGGNVNSCDSCCDVCKNIFYYPNG